VPLQGKQSDKLAQAVIDVMSGIKSQVLTITYDNGKEFADHELMAKTLETDIYFAHPYASWERGINEKYKWSDTSVFSKRHGLERCDNGTSSICDWIG
jgi:IS30 family transposase